jgi:hypothetical protein
LGKVTKFEKRAEKRAAQKTEERRRELQRAGVREGLRSSERAGTGGLQDRSGEPATQSEKFAALMGMMQQQNAGILQELAVHKKTLATVVTRLEGLIQSVMVSGIDLETGLLRPETFQTSMQMILEYNREAEYVLRIKDLSLRATRVTLWNYGRSDTDRVPLKPGDVGLLNWLLDPTSKIPKQERMAILSTFDYVDNREGVIAQLSRLPEAPPEAPEPEAPESGPGVA